MSAASLLSTVAARAIVVRSEFGVDDDGYVTSHNPIFPPTTELLISLAATLVVFGLLYKFAWPAIAKGMKDRTSRIQGELDGAAEAKAAAEKEAAEIRAALGDIDAERSRLFAEADTQAEALIADGRARLEDEVAEMEARAEADIAAAATRSSDDLRADIARYSADALERMVSTTLDDTVQQELIEGFISRVGASGGPGANGGSA
jgi:F-type H+-transporting ATPase subunit b